MEFSNLYADQLQPWVDKVVSGAVQVLEQKGLYIPYADVRSQLAGSAGLTVLGDRILFAADHSSDFLSRYRACHPFTAPAEFRLSTGGHAHHIVDLDGIARPITMDDLAIGARLAASVESCGIYGGAPGIPQDLPPSLQGLGQLLASARNRAGFPGYSLTSNPKANTYIHECLAVLGFSSSGVGTHLVSPLKFEGQEIEMGVAAVRADPQQSVGVGTMPIIGVSAPASVLGGFVMASAEVMGGGMIFHAMGTPVERLGLWVNAYPFDMRHGSFVYGNPANMVCTMLERAINRTLGAEVVAKSFNVMAQTPGPQACAQKGLFSGMMAAMGKKLFSGGATLSVDEVFSPVQLIYDREIFGYIKRCASMVEGAFDDSLLLVEDCISEDNFMGIASTARNFRALQWDSNIFPSRMFGQWEGAGCPMEQTAAIAECKRLLAEYEYHLPLDKTQALDEIWQRAQRELV